MDAATTLTALKAVYELIKADLSTSKADDEIQQDLCDLASKLGIKNAGVFNPLRAAVTGLQVSPPPFNCIHLLGNEEAFRRIERAINVLEKEVNKNV
jgi:glutamyl/glutaminyl-tRNA synthetase